jgi:hypothetical protein
MKTLIWLACVGGVAYGAYWYVTKPGCGSRGALACPPAELEEGVGVTLSAAEVCPRSGYLCVEGRNRPVMRWPLDKGRLKINVPLPEFASGESGGPRCAAASGDPRLDGHRSVVIDTTRPIRIGMSASSDAGWHRGAAGGAARRSPGATRQVR